jgi:hypothetical protein
MNKLLNRLEAIENKLHFIDANFIIRFGYFVNNKIKIFQENHISKRNQKIKSTDYYLDNTESKIPSMTFIENIED